MLHALVLEWAEHKRECLGELSEGESAGFRGLKWKSEEIAEVEMIEGTHVSDNDKDMREW